MAVPEITSILITDAMNNALMVHFDRLPVIQELIAMEIVKRKLQTSD
jgi:hypothetical protein